MSQINYIQFHIGDFLKDTLGMDATEVGAYMMLLCAHFQAGEKGLQDSDVFLSRIAKVGAKTWTRIKPQVLKNFTLEDGFWTSAEVKDLLRRKENISSIERAKALKRWNSDDATALPRQCITNNQEPITNVKEKNIKKRNPEPEDFSSKNQDTPENKKPLFPNWIPPSDWVDFETMRHQIKKPLTDRARELAWKQLAELRSSGNDPSKVLQQSILNNWAGLFPLRHGNLQTKAIKTENRPVLENWDYA